MRSKPKSRSGSEGHENIVMENCGISKGLGQRIVNGRNAAEGTYPWIVAILKYGDAWY
jgi:secreted trypsin-like serine protease